MNINKKYPAFLFLIVIALIVGTGCTQSTAPQAGDAAPGVTTPGLSASRYTDLTPAQGKDLIAAEKDLMIVDDGSYYANGHIPGAISIPLTMLDARISTLDKTKPRLV